MYPVWIPGSEEARVETLVVGTGFKVVGIVSEEDESVRPESASLAGSWLEAQEEHFELNLGYGCLFRKGRDSKLNLYT